METTATPGVEPESVEAQPAPPEAPAAEAQAPPPQLEANYHVSIWDQPPSFLCLRCPTQGLTAAAVADHVTTAHGETPAPSPLAAQYLDQTLHQFLTLAPPEEAPDVRADARPEERVDDGEPAGG